LTLKFYDFQNREIYYRKNKQAEIWIDISVAYFLYVSENNFLQRIIISFEFHNEIQFKRHKTSLL